MRARVRLAGLVALLSAVLIVVAASVAGGGRSAPGAEATAVQRCTGPSRTDFACHERRYHDLVHGSGVRAAFAELERSVRADGFVRVACHDLTHVIGHAAGHGAGAVPADLVAAFGQGSPMCAGGYYHGVTAGRLAAMRPGEVLRRADAFCADVRRAGPGSFRHYSCVHGLGHGFMAAHAGNLGRALRACDRVTRRWERETCYGGVFVEVIADIGTPDDPPDRLRPAEPLYPCTAVRARYQVACYERQTAYALYVLDNDYGRAFALCSRVPRPAAQPGCWRGLGGSAAAHALKYVSGPEAIGRTTRGLCLVGRSPTARASCVRGAVRNFVHYDQRFAQARRFCAALPKGRLRAVCRRTSEERGLRALIRPLAAGRAPAPATGTHRHTSAVTATACRGPARLDYACHARHLRQVVERDGVAAAFAVLRRERRRGGSVRTACHYLTHVIGRAAGERHRDLADAYARGDDLCSAGYYHGVTDARVRGLARDRLRDGAGALCAALRDRSKARRNCAHGLGHGFMEALRRDVFAALRACDRLPDASERRPCAGGVFMENVLNTDDPGRPSRFLRPDRPLYPCTVVPARHKDACYEKQASYALLTRGDDFASVFVLCGRVHPGHRAACHRGLGTSAAGHVVTAVTGGAHRARATRRLCALGGGGPPRRHCAIGAVRTFLHFYEHAGPARAFCRSLQPPGLRRVCLEETRTHDARSLG